MRLVKCFEVIPGQDSPEMLDKLINNWIRSQSEKVWVVQIAQSSTESSHLVSLLYDCPKKS